MANWHFKKHSGFGEITQSTSAEAFEGAAVKDLATSLVRESVQNVLDVALDGPEPPRVRFTLIDHSAAVDAGSAWFDGLMDHLQQRGFPDAPRSTDACPCLLIEDFQTTGRPRNSRARYPAGTTQKSPRRTNRHPRCSESTSASPSATPRFYAPIRATADH